MDGPVTKVESKTMDLALNSCIQVSNKSDGIQKLPISISRDKVQVHFHSLHTHGRL